MAGTRLVIVVALLVGFALARRLYASWRTGLHHEARPHPILPHTLVEGAERTWVLFTTPFCGSCGPVEEQLRAHDPAARVVKVDATVEPDLAGAFHIRSAPTVLLADAAGEVRERLVGAAAVNAWVTART